MMQRINIALYLSVVMGLFFMSYTHAQNTPVFCYATGSSDCLPGDDSILMTYAQCCSQSGAANIYYKTNSSSSQCTLCGPVFLVEESYPTFVTDTVLIIEWKLHPNSIPVSRYRSLYYEQGSTPEQAIPSDFDPPAFSQRFVALTVGVKYLFSVIARGENDGLSELRLTWEAGKSHLPSFSEFVETENSSSSVTAEWILSCSGVFPMEQMTIRWREGINEDTNFPNDNTATFDYTNTIIPANGVLMSYQFQNLSPATLYVVRIEGRNHLGTSSTHFVIETSETPSLPNNQGGLASRADSFSKSSMGLNVLLFIAILLSATDMEIQACVLWSEAGPLSNLNQQSRSS